MGHQLHVALIAVIHGGDGSIQVQIHLQIQIHLLMMTDPPDDEHDPDQKCPCVSSCTGMPDGDYQSCNGCNVYVTCSNEIIHDDRHCPDGLVWDDNLKRCEWESTTCGTDSCDGILQVQIHLQLYRSTSWYRPTCQIHAPCVSSPCTGMPDGDYQSCNGCNVYVTCSNEIIHDDRPCPDGLVWDDNLKRCEWDDGQLHVALIAVMADPGTDPPPDTDPPPGYRSISRIHPPPCVSSCTGMPDGDYQSCNGCNVYVTCSNEIIHDDRPCPDGLVWDDNLKRCEWESTTCGTDSCGQIHLHGTDPVQMEIQ